MADVIIHFNGNTAEGTMADITVVVGEEWTIVDSSFTLPENKKFKIWSETIDGTGTTYTPGEKITFDAEKEITLYAQWEDITPPTEDDDDDTEEPKDEVENDVTTNTGTNSSKKVNSFALKKKYNFNSQPELSAILGEKFTLFKVKALLTSEEAVKYTDIVTLHTTCRPLIQTLPDSIHDLTYILFEDVNKNTTVLALEYIDINTIVEVQTINIRLNLYDVSTEDLTVLKTTLLELGYANFKISTFE